MSLIIKDLSKSFADKEILKSFSYEFSSPGLYVITGESGIGKTTLLRLIAGLDKEYSGEIVNGGIKNISFMFQEYRLFPKLDAISNALVSKDKITNEDISEAKLLLSKLKFPDEALKKRADELSGGMKQRIALARAIIKNSPILLLDEPTKELDKETLSAVAGVIELESKKRIVIVVTHDEAAELWQNFKTIKL